MRYDRSFGYAEAAASGQPGEQGYPVKVVTALATDGRSQAEIEAEVARDRVKANMNKPLSLNSPTNAVLNGSLDVRGRLYRRDGTLVSTGR